MMAVSLLATRADLRAYTDRDSVPIAIRQGTAVNQSSESFITYTQIRTSNVHTGMEMQ
jgi:hypothetical protein